AAERPAHRREPGARGRQHVGGRLNPQLGIGEHGGPTLRGRVVGGKTAALRGRGLTPIGPRRTGFVSADAPAPGARPRADRGSMNPIVNDFNIHVATVNGSGSQTANTVLLRSIFQMGVPVSGKNLFPSNIAGLPTWFTIRVNRDGYVARRSDNDITVVMNP